MVKVAKTSLRTAVVTAALGILVVGIQTSLSSGPSSGPSLR